MCITDLHPLLYNLYYPYTRTHGVCVGKKGHTGENKRSRGVYCAQMREGGSGVDTSTIYHKMYVWKRSVVRAAACPPRFGRHCLGQHWDRRGAALVLKGICEPRALRRDSFRSHERAAA